MRLLPASDCARPRFKPWRIQRRMLALARCSTRWRLSTWNWWFARGPRVRRKTLRLSSDGQTASLCSPERLLEQQTRRTASARSCWSNRLSIRCRLAGMAAHATGISFFAPAGSCLHGTPVRAVFESLLPDNGGLRRRIAARTQAERTDACSRLNAMGRDCVGALQFLPPDIAPGHAGAINGAPISKGCQGRFGWEDTMRSDVEI